LAHDFGITVDSITGAVSVTRRAKITHLAIGPQKGVVSSGRFAVGIRHPRIAGNLATRIDGVGFRVTHLPVSQAE
jgi:hypothetical protein